MLKSEIRNEIHWITSRYNDEKDSYREHGFDEIRFNRLLELMKRKLDYVSEHLQDDHSFEWTGGFNFIVTGVK